jgi:hypothetical protein
VLYWYAKPERHIVDDRKKINASSIQRCVLPDKRQSNDKMAAILNTRLNAASYGTVSVFSGRNWFLCRHRQFKHLEKNISILRLHPYVRQPDTGIWHKTVKFPHDSRSLINFSVFRELGQHLGWDEAYDLWWKKIGYFDWWKWGPIYIPRMLRF